MITINAAEFKAKCLSVLDQVAETGETIMILKGGKPVARLVPPTSSEARFPQEGLKGTVIVHGDIVGPVLPAETGEAEQGGFVETIP